MHEGNTYSVCCAGVEASAAVQQVAVITTGPQPPGPAAAPVTGLGGATPLEVQIQLTGAAEASAGVQAAVLQAVQQVSLLQVSYAQIRSQDC